MLRRSYLTLFVLITIFNSIVLSSVLNRFFGSSAKCTKYTSAEVTVTSTTYQTCGYVPTTALPRCPTIQARKPYSGYEAPFIVPTKVVRAVPDTTDIIRSQSGQNIVELLRPSFDENGRRLISFSYISQLISQISLFGISCATSALSTFVATVTRVVSSPYTCVIASPIILLPFYQGDCQDKLSLNLFTCGYVSIDNTIPVCDKRRRSLLHERNSKEAVSPLSRIMPIPDANSAEAVENFIPAQVRDRQINATSVSNVVVSSLYTCYDTGASKLFPQYNSGDCISISLCSATSTISTTLTTVMTVACGTIPAGNLPLCPAKRSVVDPSLRQNVEVTHTVEGIVHRRVPEIESSLLQTDERVYTVFRSPRAGSCASYILNTTTTIVSTSLLTTTDAYTCYTSVTKYFPAYGKGFCTATESVISGACTIFRDVTSGTFTSPNYPNNYGTNSDVCWVIIAPLGKTITLTFTDFEVEFAGLIPGTGVASTTTFCPFDVVKIYDGASVSTSPSPIIACGILGTISPNVFTSTSNYMYVTFFSEYAFQFRGFSANFIIA